MKVWKRGKARMRATPEFRWVPAGYYENRPKVFLKKLEGGIGCVETIRFITSAAG